MEFVKSLPAAWQALVREAVEADRPDLAAGLVVRWSLTTRQGGDHPALRGALAWWAEQSAAHERLREVAHAAAHILWEALLARDPSEPVDLALAEGLALERDALHTSRTAFWAIGASDNRFLQAERAIDGLLRPLWERAPSGAFTHPLLDAVARRGDAWWAVAPGVAAPPRDAEVFDPCARDDGDDDGDDDGSGAPHVRALLSGPAFAGAGAAAPTGSDVVLVMRAGDRLRGPLNLTPEEREALQQGFFIGRRSELAEALRADLSGQLLADVCSHLATLTEEVMDVLESPILQFAEVGDFVDMLTSRQQMAALITTLRLAVREGELPVDTLKRVANLDQIAWLREGELRQAWRDCGEPEFAWASDELAYDARAWWALVPLDLPFEDDMDAGEGDEDVSGEQ